MDPKSLYKPVRLVGYLILALMLVATGYAFIMTGLLWTGITV